MQFLVDIDPYLRFVHIMAAIFWMGLLWFFNLVSGKVMKEVPAEVKKEVYPRMMGPAMWWFRWSAMATVIIGLIMLDNQREIVGGSMGDVNAMILLGGILAIYMWFNVWFMIWPRQRQIINHMLGEGPKPADDVAPMAAKFSRINAWLSIPVVFMMVMSTHLNPLPIRALFGG